MIKNLIQSLLSVQVLNNAGIPDFPTGSLTNLILDQASFDQDVFKYHNLARTNPQQLIPALEERLKRYQGKILQRPSIGINLMTKEGAPAC